MSQRRLLRRTRGVALVALGLVASSTLLGGSARAQLGDPADPPSLGGYQGTAQSSGLHIFYNPEGLLPTAAILDVGAPDALATISSGPVTFARAAVADPGDLLANPDALLTQADPDYPEGTVPEWPFRITANSTVGEPRAESTPAPGLEARVEATPEGSTSESRTAASSAPGIVSMGSTRSWATTAFDGSTVQVRARTEVAGFDLLGLLEVESIVTDVVATSSGGDATLDGGTVVTGATFMDQPVIIDQDGVRTDPDAESPDIPLLGAVRTGLAGDLTEALAEAGIRVSLPGPVEQGGDTSGMLASTGLRIELEVSERTAPVLGQLLDLVPSFDSPIPDAPSLDDGIALLRATHVSAFEIGRAQVLLTARPAFVPPPFEAPAPSAGPVVAPAPPTPALSPPIARAPTPQPAAPAPAAPEVTDQPAEVIATTPTASLGAGIGALALLSLLAQPFVGDRLARAASAVLATSPTDTCPLGEES